MTTNLDHVQTFKILIIGDSSVGKSSLMKAQTAALANNGDHQTCRLRIHLRTIK